MLHLAHLIVLSIWAGVVLVESVIEIRAKRTGKLRDAAELHYWIDVLVEAPLLALVLATGIALAALAWPLGALHMTKIACGLLAVGANGYCFVEVVRRRRAKDDATLAAKSARIRMSALAVPAALVAAYLGVVHFHR
jgi:hypothetical protein